MKRILIIFFAGVVGALTSILLQIVHEPDQALLLDKSNLFFGFLAGMCGYICYESLEKWLSAEEK